MEKTKVLIAGLGGIAQVAHLPILSKMDNIEIAGLCDVDKGKAKSISSKYNVKNYFTNFDEMLAKVQADCCIICSPNNVHKEQSIKAIENKLHVLVEKPLARNFIEAQVIVDTAKKHNRKLMVGMNYRFRPDIMMQESFISARELGNIFYVKAGYLKKRSTGEDWSMMKEAAGGGVFMDLGIVLLDIALWLMKFPKVKSVSAVNYYQTLKDVEDSTFAFLRFENNATIALEASWTLLRDDDLFYCNVYGTEGSAAINPLKIFKRMHGTLVNVTPLKMEKPANTFKRSYEYELVHFFKSIQEDTGLISSGTEALERMKIVDAVYKSAKSGKEIIFK
ncbi:MAG TPA: Gfo/Idh/MocA family oxidoreductase [Ignavibacteria bacterium]|jgi:predicted dehydrogenase